MNLSPDKIQVVINYDHEEMVVGQIIRDLKNYYFRYEEDYLKTGYNISPFKLRFDNSIQRADTEIFEGLFGVFSDSQPDGLGAIVDG